MKHSKLRRQIIFEAARLMYDRQESEYYRAKMKAARKICRGWVKPSDLPSNAEIRDEIQTFARMHEGSKRDDNLFDMRIDALRMMHMLQRFRPRLIGSVLTGHIRKGSDIDLHVFTDHLPAITSLLDEQGVVYDIERKRIQKKGEERVFTHVRVQDRFPFEITVYAADLNRFTFQSSITGKAIERASTAEWEQFLRREYPDVDLENALQTAENEPDPLLVYEALLLPLENVKQNPVFHPEGDALYHSLQVFDVACDELPYDEEFLAAALLHDVGKAIDPHDHVAAGLEALEGFITPRTAWLIEHHMFGHAIDDRTIGSRAHRRLRQSEYYEDLLLLSQCDREGRCAGVETSELVEAIEYLRELATTFGY